MSDGANAAMDRYAMGDDAAFGVVYDELSPRLHRFLMRKANDAALAEDLLQQTFLHMHAARETYRTGMDVVPWAFSIARRLAIDSFRKRRRTVAVDASAAEALVSELCPEGALRAKQAARTLHATLAALPESQRTAFELIKLEGLTLAQTAQAVGESVSAVKLRAHRAYEALREALAAK